MALSVVVGKVKNGFIAEMEEAPQQSGASHYIKLDCAVQEERGEFCFQSGEAMGAKEETAASCGSWREECRKANHIKATTKPAKPKTYIIPSMKRDQATQP